MLPDRKTLARPKLKLAGPENTGPAKKQNQPVRNCRRSPVPAPGPECDRSSGRFLIILSESDIISDNLSDIISDSRLAQKTDISIFSHL